MRFLPILILLANLKLCGQLRSDSLSFFAKDPEFNSTRYYSSIGAGSLVVAGTYLVLDQAWYANHPRGEFHFFDDNQNWLQVDKAGHAFSAYQLGYVGSEIMDWSGAGQAKSTWLGGSAGLIFLTGVEIMDGFSENWGFSWGDMAANAGGTALFIGQELLWQEQRVTLKFSYYPTDFPAENPDLLGQSWQEQILKDYNGQTYWLSGNVNSLTHSNLLPEWLNLAVGYSATGMIEARPEMNFNAQRQFYLAPDIDLRKLKVREPFWKAVLKAVNCLKVPMPTLGIGQGGELKFYPLYF